MSSAADTRSDLLGEVAIQDAHAFYGRLREQDPIHYNEAHRSWVLTRYEDVAAALTDPRFTSDRVRPVYDTKLTDEQRAAREPTFAVLADWMVFTDPPDHTRLRKLVQAAFTPRAVQRLAPRVGGIVDDVLDLPESGEVDVARHVAFPIPAMVIAEMLGVPASDRELFKDWSNAVSILVFGGARDEHDRRVAQDGLVALRDYLRELLAQRRRRPADDLMTELLRAHLDDDALTEDEVVATCILLLFGGHETTTNLIANGLLTLIRHPEQAAAFAAGELDATRAIEELNRFEGPSHMIVRRAGEDIELRGTTIPAGSRVLLCQTAANRDPRQFENPDRLDLRRESARHVAFGFGIHYCLGASLARLEARTALVAMLERLRDPVLVDPEPRWRRLLVVRGLDSLPVRYGS